MDFARSICNTNAKLAIKQKYKQEFDEGGNPYEKVDNISFSIDLRAWIGWMQNR